MMIKTREVFVTDDGKEFIIREEAERHERRTRIENVVLDFYHYDMTQNEIVDAIFINIDKFYRAFS